MEKEEGREDISLKDLSRKLEDFAKARDWEKYHSPRNLLLAMVAEVGELSEIFQWKGEVERGLPNWEEADKEHLGEELSDVLLYLIRLSDICGIDLSHAASNKIVKNAIKYPPHNAPLNSSLSSSFFCLDQGIHASLMNNFSSTVRLIAGTTLSTDDTLFSSLQKSNSKSDDLENTNLSVSFSNSA